MHHRVEGNVMRMKALVPAAGILSLFFATQASAGPLVVSCGSGQRAIVRNAFADGHPVTRVSCANGGGYRYAGYRTRYVTQEPVVRRNRSWGKSALIIGGSAATGAGVGGLVHGKNGALIGTALGAGAASIYEGAKRR
jgi:hypothetical protein